MNLLQDSENVGRVIIYESPRYNIHGWKFTEKKVLLPKGRKPGTLFGFSIANIGDIDKDALEDFVVGAPMGGEDGAGEIYVFHGSIYFNFGKRTSDNLY